MSLKFLTPLLLLIVASSIYGAPIQATPRLGQPILNGTGCSPGTVGFTISPDDATLSVIFDDYRVDAGNGTSQDTKNCQIALPMVIPPGTYLTVFRVDYRGFNSLPI